MKTPIRPLVALAAALSLPWTLPSPLAGQAPSTTTVSPAPAQRDEVVELSPFEVNATEDRGYQAQSSLSGSRMRTDLKDVAAAVTAFTEQFLEDIAVSNTADLAEFMVGVEFDFGEDNGGQNRLIDGDSPVRVRGLPGGSNTVNFFQAPNGRLDTFSIERIEQARGPNATLFAVGNPGGIVNSTTKQARLNRSSLMLQARGGSHGTVRGEFDVNQLVRRDRLAVRFAGVTEDKGTWRPNEYMNNDRFFGTAKLKVAPKTTLNLEGELGHLVRNSQRTFTAYDAYSPWRDAGRHRSETASAAQSIIVQTGGNRAVLFTDTHTVYNTRGSTTGAKARMQLGQNPAITDFDLLPRTTAIKGPGFEQERRYHRLSLSLSHAVTRHWDVELAGLRQADRNDSYDNQLVDGNYLWVDADPTLPTGAANPNAGRPFLETFPQRNLTDSHNDAFRLSSVYRFDLGRHFGRHLLGAVYQYSHDRSDRGVLREAILVNPFQLNQPENGQNFVYRRTYVNLAGPERDIVHANWRDHDVNGLPVLTSLAGAAKPAIATGWVPFNANTQINSNRTDTTIAMLQSVFLGNRLHTIVGGSREEQHDFRSTNIRGSLAPFAQGLLVPVPDPVGQQTVAEAFSFSAVLRALPWLSLTFSRSGNKGLPNTGGIIESPDRRPPRPQGKSQDVGLKLDLLEGRLFVTVQYFQTTASDDFNFQGVLATDYNPIWRALDNAGVLRANNLTFDQVNSSTTGTTYDSESDGLEVELTANLTPGWRTFLNYSNSEMKISRIGRHSRAYIAANRDLWLRGNNGRILLDDPEGALAPMANDADGQIETVAEQVEAIDAKAFNLYVVGDGRRPLGQTKHKVNFRSSYELRRGPLPGLTVGGGFRYRSPRLINFTALSDAAGNVVRTARYGETQFFVDLNVAYRRKVVVFGRGASWSIQLNVNNALDNDDLVVLARSETGETVNYRFNDPRTFLLTTRLTF